MRWVVWLLVAFATAVAAALLLKFNHGNVAILWPPYRIELSVNAALLLLAVGFLVLHGLLVAVGRALRMPGRVREYRARRQAEQAVGALRDGVLSYFEGRLARVDKAAQAAQAHPATAAPAALVAARAAQRMKESDRRDRWLEAAAGDAAAGGALLMTRAELAVDDQRPHEAIECVEQFHQRGARHIVSLRTALRAYEQAGRWDDVVRTLRLLDRRDALHPAAAQRLRARAHGEQLAARAGDAIAIRTLWRSLRADERALPEVAAATARALAAAGAADDGRPILEQALDAAYDERLVDAYGAIGGGPLRDRLERLEGWRRRYGDEPRLMLALGRVCMGERLWGKAEAYLVHAAGLRPSLEAHLALGELYDALGRDAEAAEQHRRAARLAAS